MQLTGQKAVIATAVGFFLVGLLIGWLVIGWWAWPVEYYDADPVDLRASHKIAYLTMVADSYALTNDLEQAQLRLEGWPADELADFYTEMATEYIKQGKGTEAQRVTSLMTNLGIQMGAPAPEGREAAAGSGKNILGAILAVCGVLIAIVLVIGGGALGWSYLQKQKLAGTSRAAPVAYPSLSREREVEWEEETYAPATFGTFTTTYNLGDDSYDDCFPIETSSGEFLGECGVGISEIIGDGAPSLVTAFEVWLFDKSDIRTVTKVLMSEHAYSDPELFERLSAKGEGMLARPGMTLSLETATLKVEAEIKEMAYGAGEGPTESHFARLTIEMTASSKEPRVASDLGF